VKPTDLFFYIVLHACINVVIALKKIQGWNILKTHAKNMQTHTKHTRKHG